MVALRQFAALTYTGGVDWWVVFVGEMGESKEDVKEKALNKLWAMNGYDQAKANLNVVTVPTAKRAFRKAWRAYEFQSGAGAPH